MRVHPHPHPHLHLHPHLQILEACLKNENTEFHIRIASDEWLAALVTAARQPEMELRTRARALLQELGCEPQLKIIAPVFKTTYQSLKSEGMSFPLDDGEVPYLFTQVAQSQLMSPPAGSSQLAPHQSGTAPVTSTAPAPSPAPAPAPTASTGTSATTLQSDFEQVQQCVRQSATNLQQHLRTLANTDSSAAPGASTPVLEPDVLRDVLLQDAAFCRGIEILEQAQPRLQSLAQTVGEPSCPLSESQGQEAFTLLDATQRMLQVAKQALGVAGTDGVLDIAELDALATAGSQAQHAPTQQSAAATASQPATQAPAEDFVAEFSAAWDASAPAPAPAVDPEDELAALFAAPAPAPAAAT